MVDFKCRRLVEEPWSNYGYMAYRRNCINRSFQTAFQFSSRTVLQCSCLLSNLLHELSVSWMKSIFILKMHPMSTVTSTSEFGMKHRSRPRMGFPGCKCRNKLLVRHHRHLVPLQFLIKKQLTWVYFLTVCCWYLNLGSLHSKSRRSCRVWRLIYSMACSFWSTVRGFLDSLAAFYCF